MILSPSPDNLTFAVDQLNQGHLIGLPTETVYGLAADAENPQAVSQIFRAKGRPADHPLIVHIASAAQLDEWATGIPQCARQLAEAFWPGPLTLILPRHERVPDCTTGGQDTVGLRVPAHPVALQLLRQFGGGLAAPSANRFGRISPTQAEHVVSEFGGRIPVLDGGACQVGIESTIVDCSRGSPVVLRPGQISPEQLAAVLGYAVPVRSQAKPAPTPATPITPSSDSTPRVSGSLAAHYAPQTPLELLPREALLARLQRHADQALAVIWLGEAADLTAHWPHQLVLPADADGFARDLYAALRQADDWQRPAILLEMPPRSDAWLAIHDRLGRAATGSGPQNHPAN